MARLDCAAAGRTGRSRGASGGRQRLRLVPMGAGQAGIPKQGLWRSDVSISAGDRDLGAGAAHGAVPHLLHAFVRVPELSKAYADLGGAELLAGDEAAAIASLNQSAKEDPSDARSLYLRARAKELSGQMEGALADYNLASRNAFAAAKELASGEAHLYRGSCSSAERISRGQRTNSAAP